MIVLIMGLLGAFGLGMNLASENVDLPTIFLNICFIIFCIWRLAGKL